MADSEGVSSSAVNTVKLDDYTYTWTQTLKEIELSAPVPQGTRGKDLTIVISKQKLSIALKGQAPLFSGALAKDIKVDDSTWTIDDQREINVHLEKINQEWWSAVIQGHPTIDTTKIQPENSKLGDLDSETRAMVEKMMVRSFSRRSLPLDYVVRSKTEGDGQTF